jgi:cell division GTPase FtsZ
VVCQQRVSSIPARPGANLLFGAVIDPEVEDGEIQITVIATGFLGQPKGESDGIPSHLSLPPWHLPPLVAAGRMRPRQGDVRAVGHTQIQPLADHGDSS